MNYIKYSHRHALTILENEEEYREVWAEIQHILTNLSDQRIIDCYNKNYANKNNFTWPGLFLHDRSSPWAG